MGSRRDKKKKTRPNRPAPWYFRLLAILLPFVLLALVEGGLRLAGVAKPAPLFLAVDVGSTTYLQLNPGIGKRFFPPSLGAVIPRPNFQVFTRAKSPGVKRVLCLGESSTAGFPFPVTGGFPALLQLILAERDPGTAWEVVNCGLTATSSSTVAALRSELLDVDPDALVIYMGHNEFYGAGGSASLASSLFPRLEEIRLVRLLEGLVRPRTSSRKLGTLMERMVKEASVPPASSLRDRAYSRFRGNLEGIVRAAQKRNVQVILCEVVSNERDFYPFGSPVSSAAGPSTLAARSWVLGHPTREQALAALPELERAAGADSLHAGVRYLRGLARLAAGNPSYAYEFRSARNLDCVPFRAPDSINRIIREVAASRGATIVPTEEVFRRNAPGGIPGHEAFIEHLHPTFLGNARIASGAADALLGRPTPAVTAADAGRLFIASGLTRFDLAYADARIAALSGRWPYAREGEEAPPFPYRARSVEQEVAELLVAAGDSAEGESVRVPDPEETAVVRDVLNHRLEPYAAHRLLADAAVNRGQLAKAAREYAAAASQFPVDPTLWENLAELRLRLGDTAGAAAAARRALVWDPTSRIAGRILGGGGE